MANKKRTRLQFHPQDESMIVIGAFRYYLGRMTISVSGFCDWICMNWENLEEGTRNIVTREIEDAFHRDAGERLKVKETGATQHWFPLGMDCDKAKWAQVRRLYRTPTCVLCGTELQPAIPQSLHLDGERSCQTCAPFECEVCEKPFSTGEQIIPNISTRRSRHPGCKPKVAA